jgi:putative DNA primase/helicase
VTKNREKINRGAVAAADFLRRRFGTAPAQHFILIWVKQGEDKRSFWLPVGRLDRAESFLDQFCTETAGDVYVGVALSPADYGPGNRCPAEAAAGITGLWADVDVKGEAHKKKNLPETLDEARELARSLGVLPTEEIHSGHGLQAYWEFTTPWIFRDDADRQKAADLVRRFQGLLKEKAKAKGWEIDSTYNLARVLRLPGTWNHKTGDPAPVHILTSGEEPTTRPAPLISLARGRATTWATSSP